MGSQANDGVTEREERRRRGRDLPDVLKVRYTQDAADGAGNRTSAFPVDHPYVELLYTPSIGPLSMFLLRRLADIAERQGAVPTLELAVAAGVRAKADGRLGANSSLGNALDRPVRFRLATWTAPDEIAVVERVKPLPDRALQRLPDWLQEVHFQLVA